MYSKINFNVIDVYSTLNDEICPTLITFVNKWFVDKYIKQHVQISMVCPSVLDRYNQKHMMRPVNQTSQVRADRLYFGQRDSGQPGRDHRIHCRLRSGYSQQCNSPSLQEKFNFQFRTDCAWMAGNESSLCLSKLC